MIAKILKGRKPADLPIERPTKFYFLVNLKTAKDRALWALHTWLDSWSGIGRVAAGMARQGFDLQLTRYDERAWRATFYTTGMEHSPTSATGSAWERTPWHAVQGAARDALRRPIRTNDAACGLMGSRTGIERAQLLRRGELLEVATVAWNVVEGVVAVAAGVLASSVALVGFGVDSFVETASGAVVGWRLRAERRGHAGEDRAEMLERRAGRIAGGLLLGLAVYIVVDACRRLLGYGAEARESVLGIVLTAISLVVMPLLGWGEAPHCCRTR